jgi:hypothetical protein
VNQGLIVPIGVGTPRRLTCSTAKHAAASNSTFCHDKIPILFSMKLWLSPDCDPEDIRASLRGQGPHMAFCRPSLRRRQGLLLGDEPTKVQQAAEGS